MDMGAQLLCVCVYACVCAWDARARVCVRAELASGRAHLDLVRTDDLHACKKALGAYKNETSSMLAFLVFDYRKKRCTPLAVHRPPCVFPIALAHGAPWRTRRRPPFSAAAATPPHGSPH